MKTRILLKSIVLFIAITLQSATLNLSFSQGYGWHMGWSNNSFYAQNVLFENLSISGKVIIEQNSNIMGGYFLDTNNDGKKDYQLSFGPYWYSPNSGVKIPGNGDFVTITGYTMKMMNPPMIMVLMINGLIWRDTIGTNFSCNPWGNQMGDWNVKDSLSTIILKGKVLIDSISNYMNYYYLDNNNDNKKDYMLMFGPWWYQPKSGAKRPTNNTEVTVKGGLINRNDLKIVMVYEINGLAWIDSVGKYPWPGMMIQRGSNMGSMIGSIYNQNTNATFQPFSMMMGMGMGMMFSSIFASMMDIDPVDLPINLSNNIVAAYSINIMDENSEFYFQPFANNIRINLNYNDKQLSAAGIKNADLELKYIGVDNIINDVPNASINYSTKTISLEQASPNGIYFIQSKSNKVNSVETSKTSESFSLSQNYPNPFNPTTNISFSIPQSGNVRLVIYSILGTKIKELVDKNLEKGNYSYEWDGNNSFGNKVASGIYLFKLEYGSNILIRKMNLLK